MAAVVRLEWRLDSRGYDIKERPAGAGPGPAGTILDSDPGGIFIVPRGGTAERYVLEGTENRVFEDLVNAPPTPEGALAFAEKWGLLFDHKEMDVVLHDPPHGMADGAFCMAVKRLGRAAELVESGDLDRLERTMQAQMPTWQKPGVGPLRVRFGRMRGDSSPRVFLEPPSLLSFAQLELMQAIAGGAKIQSCLNCGAFFSIGVERGTRITRQYCSDRCRVAMHRRAKCS